LQRLPRSGGLAARGRLALEIDTFPCIPGFGSCPQVIHRLPEVVGGTSKLVLMVCWYVSGIPSLWVGGKKYYLRHPLPNVGCPTYSYF